MIPFDAQKCDFGNKQIQLNPLINDSILDIREGIFGGFGSPFVGISFTQFNQLRLVKTSHLLFYPKDFLLSNTQGLMLEISNVAAVENYCFNEGYLFYSFYEES